jgi:hypothetical protein
LDHPSQRIAMPIEELTGGLRLTLPGLIQEFLRFVCLGPNCHMKIIVHSLPIGQIGVRRFIAALNFDIVVEG